MGKIRILNFEKEDLKPLKKMLMDLDVFNDMEIKVAIEMAEEYIKIKRKSGYIFMSAKENGNFLGFVCFGPTPLTLHTYDLYWLAVSKDYQRKSVGKILLRKCEEEIKKDKGRIVIVETSSTKKYEKARKFYKKFGYKKNSEIKNFYKLKDNKIIYVKYLKGGK